MAEKLYEQIGSYTPDNLIAGENVPILVKGIDLEPAQGVLARGSVIGVITVSGRGKLAAKASEDGSQTAKYILADTIDTGAEGATDVITAQVYESGLFNRQALTFAASNTSADHENSLRQHGIFLRDNIAY